jgi:hypothetical protein
MARILTKLRISEVSAVDKAAGDGTKILLMKRDDTPRSKPHLERYQRRLRKLRESRSFNAIIKQLDDQEISELSRDDSGGGGASDHHASKVADLLVEAGSFPHRAAALQHLLHKPSGQALLARMHKAADQTAKETTMTSTSTHAEFVRDVVKQYGFVALAKSGIRDQKSYGLDEPAATRLATEDAQRLYPSDRPDVAFSKLYQSEESVRRFFAVLKAMPFIADVVPVMVGGEDTRDLSDTSKAIEQLKTLGARRWPTASAADQFERALCDPVNHKLARLAVPIPQATTSFPFPR